MTFAGFFAYLLVFIQQGYPASSLAGIGFSFDQKPVLCSFGADGWATTCGGGCDGTSVYRPVYMPAGTSCSEGCSIPRDGDAWDPFSAFTPQVWLQRLHCMRVWQSCMRRPAVYALLPCACKKQAFNACN